MTIYKVTLDVTVHFEKLVAGFSRYHKYTLGTELREASRGVPLARWVARSAAKAEFERPV